MLRRGPFGPVLSARQVPPGYHLAARRDWRVLGLRAPGNIAEWRIRNGRVLAPPGTVPTPGFVVLRRGARLIEVWVHPQVEIRLPARSILPVPATRAVAQVHRATGPMQSATMHAQKRHAALGQVQQQTSGQTPMQFTADAGIALSCCALLVAVVALWSRTHSPHRTDSSVKARVNDRGVEVTLELLPIAGSPVAPEPVVPEPEDLGERALTITPVGCMQSMDTVPVQEVAGQEDGVWAEIQCVAAEIRSIGRRAQRVGDHSPEWQTVWGGYTRKMKASVTEIRRLREWLARTRSERLMVARELDLDRRRELVNRAWGRHGFFPT